MTLASNAGFSIGTEHYLAWFWSAAERKDKHPNHPSGNLELDETWELAVAENTVVWSIPGSQ
jgi:hypothetical protein